MSIAFNDTETMCNASPLLAGDSAKISRRVCDTDPKTILLLGQMAKRKARFCPAAEEYFKHCLCESNI